MGAGRKNCEEDKDTLASLLFPDTRRAPPQGLFTRCSFLGTRLPGATTLTPGFCQVSAEISPYQRVSHPTPPDSMSTPHPASPHTVRLYPSHSALFFSFTLSL